MPGALLLQRLFYAFSNCHFITPSICSIPFQNILFSPPPPTYYKPLFPSLLSHPPFTLSLSISRSLSLSLSQ
ncbi:hypothetical protein RJ641_016215 [Dillenia turbinata]|uniref:Uncharacterized protein n=1 Tax=Dillenia turbinata TaxID=194707 RepID=A0AAN8Z0T8_9MAGN